MSAIQKEMVVNDVVQEHPNTLGVFNRWGIDSCCGGAKRLEEVARAHRFDLEQLLKDLNAATGSAQ